MFLCYLSNRNKKRRRKKETLPTIRDLFFCNCLSFCCCFDPNLTLFFRISNIPYVPSYLKPDPVYMVAFQESFPNQIQQQSTKKSYLLAKQYWPSL